MLILTFATVIAAHSISYGGLLDRPGNFADLAALSEEGLQALKHESEQLKAQYEKSGGGW